MSEFATETSSQTLGQRLSERRLPVTEGLRYAMLLADALRKLHDSGGAHGAVAPRNIALTTAGLELQDRQFSSDPTPYAAPEVLEGRPADARSDVFSFGAVLYEMLTGRAPYQGGDRTAPPPTGSPAVDRLLGQCMAPDPALRCQRMQKVILELKLLSAAAARASAPSAARRDAAAAEWIHARLQAQERKTAAIGSDLQAAISALEERTAAHWESSGQALAELRREAQEAIDTLRGQLAAAEERAVRAEESRDASREQIALLEKRIANLEHAAPPIDSARVEAIESGMEAVRKHGDQLHDLVADLSTFERSLRTQAGDIESVRTAVAQTDDLVERIVEALESLQNTVLDSSEERAMAAH